MESLNALAGSLPAQRDADSRLSEIFKDAACRVAELYMVAGKETKRAYNSGYSAACQDLLALMQQSVSADGADGVRENVEGKSIPISQLMGWVGARMEAIKAREEEEDEEEQRTKSKDRAQQRPPTSVPVPATKSTTLVASTSSFQPPRAKDTTSRLPTPSSPTNNATQIPSAPSSPSPPPPINRPTIRSTKARTAPREPLQPTASHTPFPHFPSTSGYSSITPNTGFANDTLSAVPFPDSSLIMSQNAKKKQAVMMRLDSGSPTPITIGPTDTPSTSPPAGLLSISASPILSTTGAAIPSTLGKRRARSSRSLTHLQSLNQNMLPNVGDAMDVEEDGRERKRLRDVTRR